MTWRQGNPAGFRCHGSATGRAGDARGVVAMLGKTGLPLQPDVNAGTRDLLAIIKGMIDAAGQHGETDLQALAVRVDRATFGYLDAVQPSDELPLGAGPTVLTGLPARSTEGYSSP